MTNYFILLGVLVIIMLIALYMDYKNKWGYWYDELYHVFRTLRHGQWFPCPTCGNPNTKLDKDTPEGQPLPPGEWCWYNTHSKMYECSECWLK